MTLLLESPNPEVAKSFELAMAALSSHPNERGLDDHYSYLSPIRALVLTGEQARGRSISNAVAIGWQFLIADAEGLAVVELDDDAPDSFGSIRRGGFAARFESILRRIEDMDSDDLDTKVEVIDIPEYGTSAVVTTSDETVRLYPMALRGKPQPLEGVDLSTFFAAIFNTPAPTPPATTVNSARTPRR